MTTKKPQQTAPSQVNTPNFLVIPANEMGWENFPSTDRACASAIALAFEKKLSEGWVLRTTIYKNVGHYRDRPFLVFQRVASGA